MRREPLAAYSEEVRSEADDAQAKLRPEPKTAPGVDTK